MKGSLLQLAPLAVSTVHVPIHLKYGYNHKVATELVIPSTNTTIEVVYDQGSENFWVFAPGAIENWGCNALGCQGHCNASIQTYYDYTKSPTASTPINFTSSYAYGGFDKILQGDRAVNDTFLFANAAGESSTVPNVRVALENYVQLRFGDSSNCTATPITDLGILGISPVYHNEWRNTTGPSFRQDLLDLGLISAPVQSMWFEQGPDNVYGTYTGGSLLGGIETSKYTGPLVKVNNTWTGGQVGYFTTPPTVSVNGVTLPGNGYSQCQLDSGTHEDDLPISFSNDVVAQFFNLTGISYTPNGQTAWPGPCESIPRNRTIDLTFAGTTDGESVTVKVPLRAYVRFTLTDDTAAGYCTLSLGTGGCMLGAPFATAAFFAADDEADEIALAQGGVAPVGSGINKSAVVASLP